MTTQKNKALQVAGLQKADKSKSNLSKTRLKEEDLMDLLKAFDLLDIIGLPPPSSHKRLTRSTQLIHMKALLQSV